MVSVIFGADFVNSITQYRIVFPQSLFFGLLTVYVAISEWQQACRCCHIHRDYALCLRVLWSDIYTTHSAPLTRLCFRSSGLDPDIRYCVLASLDERFDAHLAQAENLQALFVALNDEVFEIRELAICTIGRLSSMNPAFVMPFLRKMLIQVGLIKAANCATACITCHPPADGSHFSAFQFKTSQFK